MSRQEVQFRLKCPFTAILSGPTGSGKTELIKKLISYNDYWCTQPPVQIIYCYGAWQQSFENVKKVDFHEGLIDVKEKIPDDYQPRWLIIDDLLDEVSNNAEAQKIFTVYSHHKNLSVFFITQNFFSKSLRTITLNAHYIFFFKNPRDSSQIASLGKQIFPGNHNRLQEAYRDATTSPHSHILLDLTQSTDNEFRLLGGFGEDPAKPIIIY